MPPRKFTNMQGHGPFLGDNSDVEGIKSLKAQWDARKPTIVYHESLEPDPTKVIGAKPHIDTVFDSIVTHDNIANGRIHRLGSPERTELLEFVVSNCTKGLLDMLTANSREYPSIRIILTTLHDCLGFPWWVIYFKIAVSRIANLPVLGYAGSPTSRKGKRATGAEQRCRLGHVVDMERGVV